MDEFALIRRYFSRANADERVLVGVGDDGAVLRPAAGTDLIAVVDTLVEGVHYPASLHPADVGFRAVAVNLSDIAAMGGRPRWMTLALTLTAAEPDWLASFSEGVFAAADEHGVELVGGDTTSGAQTVATVQILGEVEPDRVLMRSGASAGDAIFVSGTVGDAAAGLRLIEADTVGTPAARYLAARFSRPSARIELGVRIAGIASAAIDVSDGLYADLMKLCEASRSGARIDVGRLPVSDELASAVGRRDRRRFALSGGDDYELCFTAGRRAERQLAAIGDELDLRITRIGEIVDGAGIECRDGEDIVEYDDDGYVHFQEGGH